MCARSAALCGLPFAKATRLHPCGGRLGGRASWQPPPPPPAPSPSLVKIAVCKTIRLSQQVYGSLLQPFRASQPTGLTSVLKSGGITSERGSVCTTLFLCQIASRFWIRIYIPKVDHRFNIYKFTFASSAQHKIKLRVLCSEMVIVFWIKPLWMLAQKESALIFASLQTLPCVRTSDEIELVNSLISLLRALLPPHRAVDFFPEAENGKGRDVCMCTLWHDFLLLVSAD